MSETQNNVQETNLSEEEQDILELQKLGLDTIVPKLYQHPKGSDNYFKILTAIQRLQAELKDDAGNFKYHELVVCRPNHFTEPGLDAEKITDTFVTGDILKRKSSFFANNDVKLYPRFVLEHNPAFLQYVVAGYITDGTDFILLQTKPDSGRISNKITMVQGHVSFEPAMHTSTEYEFCQLSMKRELKEELVSELQLYIPRNYKEVVFDHKNTIGLEHIGFIYEITTGEYTVDEVFEKMKTNESSKHEPVIIRRKELEELIHEKGDNWTKIIFETDEYMKRKNKELLAK